MKTINYNANHKIALLATFVGLLTGIIALIFNKLLVFAFNVFETFYHQPIYYLVGPFVAALLVGFIRHRLLRDHNQGFGVAQVMFEIERIETLEMKPLDVMYKIIGTFITLLAGFSAGRQGPIVHIGGAVGSNIAFITKTNKNETRVLIGCGVAGCLAGVFNSPIFATLFVVEILFKKRYFDMISTILLSALTSTLFVRLFDNHNYLSEYLINYDYQMNEMPNFILLGIIVGTISLIYVVALRSSSNWFGNLNCSQYLKNIIGALAIGFSLYFLKDFYFYDISPTQLLVEPHSIMQLIGITVAYIALTAITIGSGGIGGIFAPGLFIGLTSGLAVSKVFVLLNMPVIDIKTYAVAGMAAMFSGFAIAPLSGTLMIVELTGQYNLLFPILICALISSKFNETFIKDSVYHKNLNDLLLKN